MRTRMRSQRFLALLGAVALIGAASPPVDAQQSLTWTAGAVGGGWYTISGGMAELMREKAGLNIKVIPGGGTQNPVLVQTGEAEIGAIVLECTNMPPYRADIQNLTGLPVFDIVSLVRMLHVAVQHGLPPRPA